MSNNDVLKFERLFFKITVLNDLPFSFVENKGNISGVLYLLHHKDNHLFEEYKKYHYKDHE